MKPTTQAMGTPNENGQLRTGERKVTPRKQIIGRALIDWLGKLTLSGGDLDGQKFEVWPWERRFIAGTFGQPGNAANDSHEDIRTSIEGRVTLGQVEETAQRRFDRGQRRDTAQRQRLDDP